MFVITHKGRRPFISFLVILICVLLLISTSSVYLYRRFTAKNSITSISKCEKLNFGDFIFGFSKTVHSPSIHASQPHATQLRNVDWFISRLANITFDCDSIKDFVTAKFMYKHTPCLVFPNESVRLKSPREWLLWMEKYINSARTKKVSIVLEEWALRLSYKNHVIGAGCSGRLDVDRIRKIANRYWSNPELLLTNCNSIAKYKKLFADATTRRPVSLIVFTKKSESFDEKYQFVRLSSICEKKGLMMLYHFEDAQDDFQEPNFSKYYYFSKLPWTIEYGILR